MALTNIVRRFFGRPAVKIAEGLKLEAEHTQLPCDLWLYRSHDSTAVKPNELCIVLTDESESNPLRVKLNPPNTIDASGQQLILRWLEDHEALIRDYWHGRSNEEAVRANIGRQDLQS